MDNQDFFAAAHGRGALRRWELSVKEVNQATKRPTESSSSSSTTSTTIPTTTEFELSCFSGRKCLFGALTSSDIDFCAG